MNSGAALAGVALIVAGWTLAACPSAAAVTPPDVEDSALPAPAAPRPPGRTERRDPCATATFGTVAAVAQLHTLGLQSVWPLSTGAGQVVAIIDTGVATHPRLTRLRGGGDYVSGGDGTDDCDGHGTLVAGIVAAAADPDDRSGFAGVAPDVTVIAIRQSSSKFGRVGRPGVGVGDVNTLAMAVRTAADLGATVINVSTVACRDGAVADRALGAAVAYAVDVKDAVVVTAAGNVGTIGQCPRQNPLPDPARPGEPDWDSAKIVVSPGWYDDYVLTVGSVGADGRPSEFSLTGPWVDVAAPGEGVTSLHPGADGPVNTFADGTAIFGTSYAAPVVSGIAALVRSRFPQLSARQVMQRIESTARHPPGGWNPYVGNGVVDALAAISDIPPDTTVTARPSESAPADAPVADDSDARTTAIAGVAGCAAAVAAVLALVRPASRLRRRRTGPEDVVGE